MYLRKKSSNKWFVYYFFSAFLASGYDSNVIAERSLLMQMYSIIHQAGPRGFTLTVRLTLFYTSLVYSESCTVEPLLSDTSLIRPTSQLQTISMSQQEKPSIIQTTDTKSQPQNSCTCINLTPLLQTLWWSGMTVFVHFVSNTIFCLWLQNTLSTLNFAFELTLLFCMQHCVVDHLV